MRPPLHEMWTQTVTVYDKNGGLSRLFSPFLLLFQLLAEEAIKLVPHLPLHPRRVSTALEQVEAKVREDGGQRLTHAFRRVGVNCPVNGHYRALDLFAQFQQLAAPAHLRSGGPHTVVDVGAGRKELILVSVLGERVVSISLAVQLPSPP